MKDFIGVGIIGTGFARTTQIPAFRACEGARVVAIASAHRENAERVARDFEIDFFTSDWRELVARDDVDLISIATPPVTHSEMTLAAFDAGKAVLCEKPMAMNAGETDLMRTRAAEVGLLSLIDHELRFLPGRRRMRDLIRDGEIGQVHHANLLFRSDSRLDPNRPWNWWSDQDAGGGALGAIGSHVVDGFRWLLETEVDRVCASLATRVGERTDPDANGALRRVTADDEANMLLHFVDNRVAKNAIATVAITMVDAGRPEHRLEVFGANGALMLEGDELSSADLGSGDWRRVEVEQVTAAEGMRDSEWSRGFTIFSREIIAALREGRATVDEAATFEDGHRTQLVLDAARVSQSSGCWQSVS
jgi:predicted dehydrogenase